MDKKSIGRCFFNNTYIKGYIHESEKEVLLIWPIIKIYFFRMLVVPET